MGDFITSTFSGNGNLSFLPSFFISSQRFLFVLIFSSAANESDRLISLEDRVSAHNYHPMPVVFDRAEGLSSSSSHCKLSLSIGVHVWDPEGKRYYDFLSAYSAVNQGHSHPKIVKVTVDFLNVLF